MEYRGIRYTIRTGIERGQCRLAIHPDGVEVPASRIFLSREDAKEYARHMINGWLDAKSRQKTQQIN